jgi:hypothetical protein
MIAYGIHDGMSRRVDCLQKEARALREVLADVTGTTRVRAIPDPQRRHAMEGRGLTPTERGSSWRIVCPDTDILSYLRSSVMWPICIVHILAFMHPKQRPG